MDGELVADPRGRDELGLLDTVSVEAKIALNVDVVRDDIVDDVFSRASSLGV
jgi:hypothetical protein